MLKILDERSLIAMDFFKSTTGGSDKKKVHKLNRINSDYDEFVIAVEHGNVNKVKNYLETATSDLDINSLTPDGLTLLNIAVIQRNRPMVKVLLNNGATENQYSTNESIHDQLETLVKGSQEKSKQLKAELHKQSASGNANQLKQLQKEFQLHERRHKKFLKMRSEYTQIRPPDPPLNAISDVIGSTSVKISIQEDETGNNCITTKYKIEWSRFEDFRPDESHVLEILDLRKMQTILNNLTTGTKYYFRVACGNCKGYGASCQTVPKSVIPSCWRDVDENCHRVGRYTGKSVVFDTIFKQVLEVRPESASEILNYTNEGNFRIMSSDGNGNQYSASVLQQQHQKKTQKMTSIKQLFNSTKFQKNFKRGVFLTCIIFSEDKLLLTTEDFLPAIEVDEAYPSTLQADFHWLLKVSCTWENVKSLKHDMEKSGSASSFHFRLKLLQATSAMQNALGVENLGRLYYKLIRDKTSSVVIISLVNHISSTKMISSINVRWTTASKVSSRKTSSTPDDISNLIINSIPDQLLYHQMSNIPLGRGLYLGYLKLASSIEHLKIIVQQKTPNLLPHVRIRDNPHVSREEWGLIHKTPKSDSPDTLNYEKNNNMDDIDETRSDDHYECLNAPVNELTQAQEIFRTQVDIALTKLFSLLEIDSEASLCHRFYTAEVVEINDSVSMIIIYPALENVCIGAGQSDALLKRNDLIAIPIQVFEMIHLNTYQRELITRYARLSVILEVDTTLAQHSQREAFSDSEVASAKQRLARLQTYQSKMDANWKGARWLLELMTTARNKSVQLVSIQDTRLFNLRNNTSGALGSLTDATLQKPANIRRLSSNNNLEIVHRMMPPLGSVSLKFSKSENQLDNLEFTASNIGGERLLPSGPIPNFVTPTPRKVSAPVFAKSVGQDNLAFISTHSQSDMTIPHSISPAEQLASSSLQNLAITSLRSRKSPIRFRIPIPPQNPATSPALVMNKLTTPIETNSHLRSIEEPPPIPHRRTMLPPLPPPTRMFPALDPPSSLPDSTIPKVQVVNSFDYPRSSWNGSSVLSPSSSSNGDMLHQLSPLNHTASSGVIQVYAAYECGLSMGTSVRLQISGQTTSKQIVDLVVKQLNSEIQVKGQREPVYERTNDFCLVAVIGARERCLRNDFKPLYLQHPWRCGRLYVRKNDDVTAAIEMNGKHLASTCEQIG